MACEAAEVFRLVAGSFFIGMAFTLIPALAYWVGRSDKQLLD